MLTDAEKAAMRERFDAIPLSRLEALQHAYMAEAADARAAAAVEGLDQRAAAALRGKARGMHEAADMVNRIIHGQSLRPPRHSTAWRRARAYRERRDARRAAEGQPEGV